MKEYKKILIVTGCGLGDVLMSVHMINAIRKYYPHARIDSISLVDRRGPGLSEGHKILEKYCVFDNIYEIDERSSVFKKFKKFLDLKKIKYDLIIDTWPTTANKLMFINTVSPFTKDTAGFSKYYSYSVDPKDDQKVVAENKLLKELGIDEKIELPKMCKDEKKENYITVSVSRDDDPLRSWPVARWAYILDKLNCPIVFVGADVNKNRIMNIRLHMKTKKKVSAFLNKLEDIPKVISGAKLHLTENCGIMHIATTTSTPVISLSQSDKGWGPYGKRNIEIRKEKMIDIKVDEVWKEIQKKL